MWWWKVRCSSIKIPSNLYDREDGSAWLLWMRSSSQARFGSNGDEGSLTLLSNIIFLPSRSTFLPRVWKIMLLCTQLLNLLVKIGIFLFSICGKRIHKYVNNHTENSPKEAMTTFCCDIYKDFFYLCMGPTGFFNCVSSVSCSTLLLLLITETAFFRICV